MTCPIESPPDNNGAIVSLSVLLSSPHSLSTSLPGSTMWRVQKFLVLVTITALLFEAVLANPVVRNDNFQLTLLHNNDMHARFVETDTWSNKCSGEAALNHKCFGGFARVAHL